MAVFLALLRAVNVGGTGKLPMKDLRAMCTNAWFESVKIYIASGNVVFESGLGASRVQEILESALPASNCIVLGSHFALPSIGYAKQEGHAFR